MSLLCKIIELGDHKKEIVLYAKTIYDIVAPYTCPKERKFPAFTNLFPKGSDLDIDKFSSNEGKNKGVSIYANKLGELRAYFVIDWKCRHPHDYKHFFGINKHLIKLGLTKGLSEKDKNVDHDIFIIMNEALKNALDATSCVPESKRSPVIVELSAKKGSCEIIFVNRGLPFDPESLADTMPVMPDDPTEEDIAEFQRKFMEYQDKNGFCNGGQGLTMIKNACKKDGVHFEDLMSPNGNDILGTRVIMQLERP
ncbi:hypothetical protein ACFL5G_05655 [Candidatus Margulisiibacteriota bacterium]